MKNLLTQIILLVFVCGTNLWAGSPDHWLPDRVVPAPVSCEIVDEIPKNGEVRLLLRVEAGKCIENVGVRWFSWADSSSSDTMSAEQTVRGADTLTFPIVMSIPEPNFGEFCLTVLTTRQKVKSEEPCTTVSKTIDEWGQEHTITREFGKEDENGKKTITFWITDGRVEFSRGFRGRPQKPFNWLDEGWIRTGGDESTFTCHTRPKALAILLLTCFRQLP